jgi:ADP-ribosylglycohydrolase
MKLEERMLGGLLGLVIGDALGVPVEFRSRAKLGRNPVTGMRGHGTHNQPPGTWSDDSSMALCTAESLIEKGYDPLDMMVRFERWLHQGYLTPHGEVFDHGAATRAAIDRFSQGLPRSDWGCTGEHENGNGSLMRMLPLSLYVAERDPEIVVKRSQEVSALTHAHPRSKICCAYYSLLVRELLHGEGLVQAMKSASSNLTPYLPEEEEETMERLLSEEILQDPEEKIRGSGYVLHCLEASVWCCHQEHTYEESVLRAVNLGEDTDTTGAVTGALAGLIHGVEAIPPEWLEALVQRDHVQELCERLVERVRLG